MQSQEPADAPDDAAPAVPVGAPSAARARPLARSRRVLFSLLPVLVVLLVLELVAWVVDANTHYRARLLDRLALLEVRNQPVEGDVALNWPARTLVVRDPAQRAKTAFVRPEDVVREGERRVFVVGGSAAFGFPLAYPDTFAAQLERRLRKDGVRVLNAAEVGCSTGRLVPVVRRIVEHFEPDTLVLYAGNNEWIQWLPEQQHGVSAGRVRLTRFLAHSRALAALGFWLVARSGGARPEVEGAGNPVDRSGFVQHAQPIGWQHALAHPMPEEFDARQWLAVKERFLDVFEENLERMIDAARERDARVVLLTVPFNHRLSPTWKHPQPWWFDPADRAALTAAHHETARLIEQGRFDDARARAQAGLAIDPRVPVLSYLDAWCHHALGDPLAAEEAFARCRENMVGNLGGRLSVNRSIRAVADRTGVTLVDVAREFERVGRERSRYYNADLILDDCHPSRAGHEIIANALEDVLR